ncbi:MAG: sodium:solute symporter [Bacteroidota bacterium]
MLIVLSSLGLLAVTPWAKTKAAFFRGEKGTGATVATPNVWVLTSSLVISWLFAKSITNAANLGLAFGLVGGVAYAAYYLSFVVAGLVIYRLRTRGGFTSIHHFLGTKYGRGAIVIFSLLIAFRLFNEVWSNTMVIGSYFGDAGSTAYTWSIVVFTALTLAYSLKGGMSSSIVTDVIQMFFFGILLVVVLGAVLQSSQPTVSSQPLVTSIISSGDWVMSQGGNLLLVAIIQSLSYPFHDPVLTDRGFITDAKTTLRSFLWAAPIGGLCIILFSVVGIYGQLRGVSGQAPVEVAKLLGPVIMLVMNFIMVTSAASTLDSTFTSFAKLTVIDLGKPAKATLSRGRWAMVMVTLLGSLPIFLGAEILSATTISGTMVIGLAPVFTLWWLKAPSLSFHLSVGLGITLGLVLVNGWWPTAWNFTEGKYASLLSINLLGTLACYFIFCVPLLLNSRTATTTKEMKSFPIKSPNATKV